MARRYDIQGTNDFLVWAVLLLAVGLWGVKDGWFPSQAVLDKHPHAVQVTAAQAGIVQDVFVKRAEMIRAEQPIVRLMLSATNGDLILKAPVQGEIATALPEKGAALARGQLVTVMTPDDSFYTFNHTLAVLALLGALGCAVIHFLVR